MVPWPVCKLPLNKVPSRDVVTSVIYIFCIKKKTLILDNVMDKATRSRSFSALHTDSQAQMQQIEKKCCKHDSCFNFKAEKSQIHLKYFCIDVLNKHNFCLKANTYSLLFYNHKKVYKVCCEKYWWKQWKEESGCFLMTEAFSAGYCDFCINFNEFIKQSWILHRSLKQRHDRLCVSTYMCLCSQSSLNATCADLTWIRPFPALRGLTAGKGTD